MRRYTAIVEVPDDFLDTSVFADNADIVNGVMEFQEYIELARVYPEEIKLTYKVEDVQ